MDNIEKYQNQLLEQTQNVYRETPISEPTMEAYLATPRGRYGADRLSTMHRFAL
jgi:hypothetical protein